VAAAAAASWRQGRQGTGARVTMNISRRIGRTLVQWSGVIDQICEQCVFLSDARGRVDTMQSLTKPVDYYVL
jgi:hypothetical protein